MNMLLNVKDSSVPFFMELLNRLDFVEAQPLTPYQSEVVEAVREAVEEMKLIKQGRLQGTSVEELLHEL